MRILLVSILIAIVLVPQFSVAQEGVPVATNTAILQEVQTQSVPTSPVRDPYVVTLEQAVEILSKTNDALNQRWTPLNVTLSALSALFTIITILWGIVFAFGYIAYKSLIKRKEQFQEESSKLINETQNTLAGFREEKDKMVKEGGEMLVKLTEKKLSTADLEEELKQFMKKSEQTIEKLEDKTLVTVSGIRSSMLTASAGAFGLGGNESALVCEKCGSVFYEKPPRRWGNLAKMTSHTFEDVAIPYGVRWGSSETLCHKCRDEGVKVQGV